MTRNLALFAVAFNAAGLVLFCWMATRAPEMGLFAGFCALWGAQAVTQLRGKREH